MKLRCRWACLTVALLLGLVFACGNCLASADLSGLSEEELQALRDQAQQELDERSKIDVKDLSDEELQALVEKTELLERDRKMVEALRDLPPLPSLIHSSSGSVLTLGMTRAEVEQIIGEPTSPFTPDDLSYIVDYSDNAFITYDGEYDTAQTINCFSDQFRLWGQDLSGYTLDELVAFMKDYFLVDDLDRYLTLYYPEREYIPEYDTYWTTPASIAFWIKQVDGTWIFATEESLKKFPETYTSAATLSISYSSDLQNVSEFYIGARQFF